VPSDKRRASARVRCRRCAPRVTPRPCRTRRVLHFLCEPSGHTSTVSRCPTGSNPRNPQSQTCGPRGARTRIVWYEARFVAGRCERSLVHRAGIVGFADAKHVGGPAASAIAPPLEAPPAPHAFN
jgi:hypothetical protein